MVDELSADEIRRVDLEFERTPSVVNQETTELGIYEINFKYIVIKLKYSITVQKTQKLMQNSLHYTVG